MPRFREPVSGFTHLGGMVAAAAGMAVLLQGAMNKGSFDQILSFAVYGTSLISLYCASALYHLLVVSDEWLDFWRRIDHIMIYVLIAGTYTPVCLLTIGDQLGWILLAAVWGIAAAGIGISIIWRQAPQSFFNAVYTIMAIIIIGFIPLLVAWMPLAQLVWLTAGYLVYIIGAVIYLTHSPGQNLFDGFGSHEIFHLFVLGGSFCHYWLMYLYLV